MKKKLLIFSSIGLLVILSAIVFWRLLLSKPLPIPKVDLRPIEQDLNPQGSGQISKEKAREIAGNIIKWLDSMKNEKGQYFSNQICSANSSCQNPTTVDKQRGIIVAWARFRNYLNSKEESELKMLDNDLTTLTTPLIGSPAQNDYLNCTLMYELYQSSVFIPEQKNKIFSICNDSIFYGKDMNNYNENAASNQSYNLEPPIESFLQGKGINTGLKPNPREMVKYSSYVADLATIYLWTKEAKALTIAKYYFNLALQLYSEKSENLDDSLLDLASMKMFEATGEEKYLDFNSFLFDQKINSLKCSNVDYCVNYLYFLDSYYQNFKGDEAIRIEKEKIINSLIARYYDSQKKLLFNLNQNETKYYPVAQNSIFSGILNNFGE